MAQSRDLLGVGLAASALEGLDARLGAGGLLGHGGAVAVAGSGDDHVGSLDLSGDGGIGIVSAAGAGVVGDVTGLGAGGGLGGHGGQMVLAQVTQRLGGALLFSAAVGAGAHLFAGLFLGGSLGLCPVAPVMAGSGDDILRLQHLAASGAVLTGSQAGFGAGGSNSLIHHHIVAGGGQFHISGIVTDGAELVSLVTLLRAGGGLSGHLRQLVTQSGDHGLADQRLAADTAVLTGGQAGLGAGGCLGCIHHHGVTQSGDLHIGGIVALGTVFISLMANLGAGRCLGSDLSQLMTQSRDLLGVGLAAGALEGLDTLLGAGGLLGHGGAVAVAGGGDDHVLDLHRHGGGSISIELAALAGVVGDVAVLGAGGSLGCNQRQVLVAQMAQRSDGSRLLAAAVGAGARLFTGIILSGSLGLRPVAPVVADGGDDFLSLQHLAASGAVLTGSQAGLGAGRCLGGIHYHTVAGGGQFHISGIVTNRAVLVSLVTLLRAGGGLAVHLSQLVTQSGNHGLADQRLAADTAVLTGGQAGFGAGRCLGCIHHHTVAGSSDDHACRCDLIGRSSIGIILAAGADVVGDVTVLGAGGSLGGNRSQLIAADVHRHILDGNSGLDIAAVFPQFAAPVFRHVQALQTYLVGTDGRAGRHGIGDHRHQIGGPVLRVFRGVGDYRVFLVIVCLQEAQFRVLNGGNAPTLGHDDVCAQRVKLYRFTGLDRHHHGLGLGADIQRAFVHCCRIGDAQIICSQGCKCQVEEHHQNKQCRRYPLEPLHSTHSFLTSYYVSVLL